MDGHNSAAVNTNLHRLYTFCLRFHKFSPLARNPTLNQLAKPIRDTGNHHESQVPATCSLHTDSLAETRGTFWACPVSTRVGSSCFFFFRQRDAHGTTSRVDISGARKGPCESSGSFVYDS